MNLATLGVAIDPTTAKQGSAEVVKAINSTGDAAVANEKRVQDATAASGRAIGANAKKGAEEHGSAVQKMAAANQKLHAEAQRGASASGGAFAQMVANVLQGVTQMAGVIPGAAGAFTSLAGGASSAAVSMMGMLAGIPELIPVLVALGVAAVGVVAALGALAIAAGAVGAGVKKAAAMEDATMGFAILLGSIEKARDRMEELSKFAAETPFELPEVVAASRVLQVFTDGALASGKGLKLVGDAAVIANRGYDEVAQSVGRMYSALKNGTPMGEAAQSLRQMGLLTGPLQTKLEYLQSTGKKGEEVWNVYAKSLERLDNAMVLKNMTLTGQLSNLADNFSRVLTALGTGTEQELTPVITKFSDWLNDMVPKAKAIGQSIGAAFATAKGMMENGTAAEAFAVALELGVAKAVNAYIKGMVAANIAAGRALLEANNIAIQGYLIILRPSFWMSLNEIFLAVAIDFGASLLDVFLTPVAYLEAGMEMAARKFKTYLPSFFGGDANAMDDFDFQTAVAAWETTLREEVVQPTHKAIEEIYAAAAADMQKAMGPLFAQMKASAAATYETFKSVFDALGEFIPADRIAALQKQLDTLLETARKLGEVKPNDEKINKLIPTAPAVDPNQVLIDDAKKAIATDQKLIEEFKKNREHLDVLIKSGDVSGDEGNRRLRDMQDKLGNSLQDPKQYSTELGKWRAFNEEKARISAETDSKIKNNELNAFQAMSAGMKQHVNAWGNMNQQMAKATGQIMDSLANGLSTAISEIVTGTKSAGEAFADMAKAVIGEIVKIITKMLIQLAIQLAINAITGQPTTANMGGAANGNFTFAAKAGGGLVAQPGNSSGGFTTPATTGSGVNAAGSPLIEPDLPTGGFGSGVDFSDPFPYSGASPGFRLPDPGLRDDFARGGQLRGGSGQKDDIPILAMGGEYVIRKSMVDQYGLAYLEAINRGKAPKHYADGGLVGPASAIAANQGKRTSGEGGVTVNVGVNVADEGGDDKQDSGGKRDRQKMQEFGRQIDAAVRTIISREKRAGGLLDRRGPMT